MNTDFNGLSAVSIVIQLNIFSPIPQSLLRIVSHFAPIPYWNCRFLFTSQFWSVIDTASRNEFLSAVVYMKCQTKYVTTYEYEEEDVMKSEECLQLIFYVYFALIASTWDHILSFLWCNLLHNFIIPKGLSLLAFPPVSACCWREPFSVCRRPVWLLHLIRIVWMALWVIIFYYWRIVFWPLWFSVWSLLL
jgi:hypothetical protein